MDWIKPALDALSSVRTFLGLLAFFAILFTIAIQLTEAARRRSLVERIGGPNVIGEAALVRLLREYKDEKERTRALMAILRHSRERTTASLEKVVADVSGEGAVLRSFHQARTTLGVIALSLILLAVIGYAHDADDTLPGIQVEDNRQSSLTPTSLRLDIILDPGMIVTLDDSSTHGPGIGGWITRVNQGSHRIVWTDTSGVKLCEHEVSAETSGSIRLRCDRRSGSVARTSELSP